MSEDKKIVRLEMDDSDVKTCTKIIKESVLLSRCSEEQLLNICRNANKLKYQKGDVLQVERRPQEKLFLISKGVIGREKTDVQGQTHVIDTYLSGSTVGSLHVLPRDPSYSTTRCASDEVETYEISSDFLNNYLLTDPLFAWNVCYGLSLEVRKHTRNLRTPLLQQKAKPIPVVAVSIAAAMESFYRAALNALMNQKLTGIPATTLFPNMHVQLPTRVLYVNGFKGIRQFLDNNLKPEQTAYPNLTRLAAAITPGVIMSPISSILEASNAGHANPEPLWKRWTRGLVPRTAREIIFGVGLNQLSDYCEERVPTVVANPTLRSAVGSLFAGVISGYLSHVVHNLSTLKLMNPKLTYGEHIRTYIKRSEARVPAAVPAPFKRFATMFAALITPTSCLIRTTQIVGTFIIINGITTAFETYVAPPPPVTPVVFPPSPPSSSSPPPLPNTRKVQPN